MGKENQNSMIKFFLEGSLKGLAKWLRFLGYEVITCERKILDLDFFLYKDHIFLVTSEKTAERLEKIGLKFLVLPRTNLALQLKLCIEKLGLKKELKLDVCSICGTKLIQVEKEQFKDQIPPKVYEYCHEFNYCPTCKKLYWEGDHVKRLREKFEKLVS